MIGDDKPGRPLLPRQKLDAFTLFYWGKVLTSVQMSLRAAAGWQRDSPLASKGIASASRERWLPNDRREYRLDARRICQGRVSPMFESFS
jgi:hypothetical protein